MWRPTLSCFKSLALFRRRRRSEAMRCVCTAPNRVPEPNPHRTAVHAVQYRNRSNAQVHSSSVLRLIRPAASHSRTSTTISRPAHAINRIFRGRRSACCAPTLRRRMADRQPKKRPTSSSRSVLTEALLITEQTKLHRLRTPLATCNRLTTAHARTRIHEFSVHHSSTFLSLSHCSPAPPPRASIPSLVLTACSRWISPTHHPRTNGPCAGYQVASIYGIVHRQLFGQFVSPAARSVHPAASRSPDLVARAHAHHTKTHPSPPPAAHRALPHWALHSSLHPPASAQTFHVLLRPCHPLRQTDVPAPLIRPPDNSPRGKRRRAVRLRLGRQHAPCPAHR